MLYRIVSEQTRDSIVNPSENRLLIDPKSDDLSVRSLIEIDSIVHFEFGKNKSKERLSAFDSLSVLCTELLQKLCL